MENGVQMTLEQWMPQIFQRQTVGVLEPHAKISLLPEKGEGSRETDPPSLEKYLESLERSGKKISLNGSSMKMLRECLAATEDLISCPYSLSWMWGGYDIEWQILNSKLHGVPQNRERVYTIGHLRRCGTRKIFPLKAADGEDCVHGISLIGTRKGYHRNLQTFAPDGITETLSTCSGGGQRASCSHSLQGGG